MINGWFITGTDTGVGKTFIAELVLEGLRAADYAAVGMKPIATGCRQTPEGLRSEDAERLIAASNVRGRRYDEINPYAFEEPIAPHLAADLTGRRILIDVIYACCLNLANVGLVVVEGIGGWRVPIGGNNTVADLAANLELPVVLVVGVRLGCLNHALLTAEAMADDGIRPIGWVANVVAPDMARESETIMALECHLRMPRLATIPYRPGPSLRAELAQTLALAFVTA